MTVFTQEVDFTFKFNSSAERIHSQSVWASFECIRHASQATIDAVRTHASSKTTFYYFSQLLGSNSCDLLNTLSLCKFLYNSDSFMFAYDLIASLKVTTGDLQHSNWRLILHHKIDPLCTMMDVSTNAKSSLVDRQF